jgi:hypothetical protein
MRREAPLIEKEGRRKWNVRPFPAAAKNQWRFELHACFIATPGGKA